MDIFDPQFISTIKQEAEDVIRYNEARRALIFVRNMESLLKDAAAQNISPEDSEKVRQYNLLLDRVRFVCMSGLREDELILLFKEKLLGALADGYIDVPKGLNTALLSIPSLASRDQLRKKLGAALNQNKENLGSNPIQVGNKSEAPAVANWIRKYIDKLGSEIAGPIEENEFFSKDKDVQKLSETHQQSLRKIIALHEFLLLSSQTLEGLEDPMMVEIGGKFQYYHRGFLEDIKLPSKAAQAVNKLFPKSAGFPSLGSDGMRSGYDESLVRKAVQEMLKETGGSIDKIFAIASLASQNSIVKTLAALLLSAQLRQFSNLLKDNDNFRSWVAEDLKNAGQDDKVDALRLSPGSPPFVARFLKIILQDKLKLSESDSKGFGLKLAKIFELEGDPYANIVVQKEGGWKWNL